MTNTLRITKIQPLHDPDRCHLDCPASNQIGVAQTTIDLEIARWVPATKAGPAQAIVAYAPTLYRSPLLVVPSTRARMSPPQ